MPNQRIYYISPRMIGAVDGWSGAADAAGQSWILDHAQKLGFNAVWFSPMNQTTAVTKEVHGQKVTGSYYAIKDHFCLDPEFSTGSKAQDLDHLRHFCQQAKDKGMRVYADLVFNHVAADHPLVLQENRDIQDILAESGGALRLLRGHKEKLVGIAWQQHGVEKSYHFKFRREDNLKLQVGGPPDDPWSDVAQVNYASPEARKYFVEGDGKNKGYFQRVIDWYLDLGFTAFRCDAAYMVPPEAWQSLIHYGRGQKDDLIFLAETLCTDQSKVERLSRATIPDGKGGMRPAFDFGMLGFYWWDFKNDWLPKDEHPRILGMSRFGGAGAPDNHDTAETLAGYFNKNGFTPEALAAISVRNYAISALASTAFYSQMGYEYCNEKQNRVFKGLITPDDWKHLVATRAGKSPLDISDRIREINEIKQGLNVENCRVHFKEYTPIEDNRAVKIHVEYLDADTGSKKAEVVLILNNKPEEGPIGLRATLGQSLIESGLVPQSGADLTALKDVLIYHSPVQHKQPTASLKTVLPSFNFS